MRHGHGATNSVVHVDSSTGVIQVRHVVGAFDFGLVINRNTALMGVKGAMIWGIGTALLEEVKLDGHKCHTHGFADYRIPRMKDTPPIDVVFLDRVRPGHPRGCGEMPMPPTIAAIANATFQATGVRFTKIPLTPERVKAGFAMHERAKMDREAASSS